MTDVRVANERPYHHSKWTRSAPPNPTLDEPGPTTALSQQLDQAQGAAHRQNREPPLLSSDPPASLARTDYGSPIPVGGRVALPCRPDSRKHQFLSATSR